MGDNPYAPPSAATGYVPAADEPVYEVSIDCATCGARIRLGDERCPGCQRATTRDQKRALRQRWESSDREVAKSSDSSYWGRLAIAVVAFLSTGQGLFLFFVEEGLPAKWITGSALLLWAAFVLSLRSPLWGCVAALAIYGVSWLAQIALAPAAALSGMELRILLVLALTSGLGAELRIRRRLRAMKTLQRRG
jgi:hypothetical protein